MDKKKWKVVCTDMCEESSYEPNNKECGEKRMVITPVLTLSDSQRNFIICSDVFIKGLNVGWGKNNKWRRILKDNGRLTNKST